MVHAGLINAEHDGEEGRRPQLIKIVADNRKARFNYEIGDDLEAGIALTGTEVKSLRARQGDDRRGLCGRRARRAVALQRQHPGISAGQPLQPRAEAAAQAAAAQAQIDKLIGAVEREGMTIVPLKLYFNERGRRRSRSRSARGKKLHDKRETEKKRDWERERSRLMRDKG